MDPLAVWNAIICEENVRVGQVHICNLEARMRLSYLIQNLFAFGEWQRAQEMGLLCTSAHCGECEEE